VVGEVNRSIAHTSVGAAALLPLRTVTTSSLQFTANTLNRRSTRWDAVVAVSTHAHDMPAT
jgi:hypothetical protein